MNSTIMNWLFLIITLLIAILSILKFANFWFHRLTCRRVEKFLKKVDTLKYSHAATKKMDCLPPIIQKWMHFSGISDHKKVTLVYIEKSGRMKTKPNAKWISYSAKQYFNVVDPAFIWIADIKLTPGIYLRARDQLENGKAEMSIKLFSIFPVVNEKNNPKIDSGAMIRFLAETCWFPSAALLNYLSWEHISETSAKATLTYNSKYVSAIFSFHENGALKSIETMRYFDGAKNAVEQPWLVTIMDHKEFQGITIPSKSRVTWKLQEEDFNWLEVEIKKASYN
ncbi:DUF6920 family protein [Ascidiimonas sp. W6]|uniref:DUF6920 family protein n=1 Tax=Ascidiimonas meishanensis TaxID=3128903 RepID=UPI0030EF9A4A